MFKTTNYQEEGVEVPHERIDPETLRRLIEEFVTRDGADWDVAGCGLDDKIEQVLRQLRDRKVVIVFDQITETANLVPCRQGSRRIF